ncbi:hypothetical protein O5190_27120 [Escherichia coli]|nr:hypothetical protein [Escherichia coli]
MQYKTWSVHPAANGYSKGTAISLVEAHDHLLLGQQLTVMKALIQQ